LERAARSSAVSHQKAGRDDREPEFVGIKIQGAILIRHRNADKFDLFNHGSGNLERVAAERRDPIQRSTKKLLSANRYSDYSKRHAALSQNNPGR
jgi:hypothetical protein